MSTSTLKKVALYTLGAFSGVASEDADDALPPLERTQLYMEADRTLSGKKSGEPASALKQKRRGSGFVRFLLILLLLFIRIKKKFKELTE